MVTKEKTVKKPPLILPFVLATLAGLASWYQYSHKPTQEKKDVQTKKPIRLPAQDSQVLMIKIKSSQGLIELKCESFAEKKCTPQSLGKWSIDQGISADPQLVKDFLYEVTETWGETIDLSVETPEKRKALLVEYGLSEEQRSRKEMISIELVLADSQGLPATHLTEWIGNDLPIGERIFVGSSIDGKMNEEKVFLYSNRYKIMTLAKTIDSFRSK